MLTISFLASHGGSAVKEILAAIDQLSLNAEVGVVIFNNRDSGIAAWCEEHQVPHKHISGFTHPDEAARDIAIKDTLNSAGTDLVILSGYMKKIGPEVLARYRNKILNIHPSLLPRHGGKGLFGDRVHEAVLMSGDTESGATVHLINEEYDEGPILRQHRISVVQGETVETLKRKIHAIEGRLYIETIKSFECS